MKRISLEIKVSVLLVIAVVIVIATGYLSYLSLSYIVTSIHKETSPDLVLLNIKEVNYELGRAENNVRLYNVTGKNIYSEKYDEIVSLVNIEIETLYTLAEARHIEEREIDTIHSLINERILIWDEMLKLSDEKRYKETISILTEKLKETEVDSLNQKRKRNFFRRIFKRNKAKKDEDINISKLREEIDEIEKRETIRTNKIKAKEQFLIQKNEELSTILNLYISKIEEQQNRSLIKKTDEADYLAKKTYRWLTLFCISGVLLIIMVLFVVFNYVKKTKVYQDALIKARNEAQELAKAKEIFIANVSHEIRSPMNAIMGLSDQLLMQNHTSNVEKQLNTVNQSANHLLGIINDILDFSKIKAGKLTIEKIDFDPYDVFKEVYELNKVLADKKNIKLGLSIDESVPDAIKGDPLRLKQISLNVINNAIKFTSEGKISIYVTTESDIKKFTKLKFIVEDTGIGIAKEKLSMIFDEFTQTELNTSRDYGGTGLGLAIVNQLVNMQDGAIEVESELGKGSKFTITIPFEKGQKVRKAITEPYVIKPANFENLSVLIVDDEEYNRTLLKVILEKLNIKYKEAFNGLQAVEEYQKNHFDFILMDIRMPIMDGIESTKQILELANKHGRNVNIIAISATNSTTEFEKCRKAGIEKILIKPFKEEELVRTFAKCKDQDFSQKQSKKKLKVENKDSGYKKLDLDELKRLAGGDSEFLYIMLEMFIKTSTGGLVDLKKGIELNNFDQIKDSAHKIIPPCRHLNALDLVDLLKQIELGAGKKKDINEISKSVVKVEKILNEYIHLIKKEMKKIK